MNKSLIQGGFILKTKIPEQISLSEFVKNLEYQKDPSIISPLIVPLIIDGIKLEYVICEPWGYNYNEKAFYCRIKFTYYPSSCWNDVILDLRANTDKYYLEPVFRNTPNIFRIEYMVLRKEKNHERQEYQMFNIGVPENLKLTDIKEALENDERFTERKVLIPAYSMTHYQSLTNDQIFSVDPMSAIGMFERVDFGNDVAKLCVKMFDTPMSSKLIELMNATDDNYCVALPKILGKCKEDGTVGISQIFTFNIVYGI